jgi:hypothetical protein
MTVKKLAVAVVGALVLGLQQYLDDNVLTSVEWVLLIGMLLAALSTWLVPNTPALATAKTWVEAIVAGTALLATLLPDGFQQQDVWPVLIAVLTAAGVYAVPNRPAVATV